MNLEKSSVFFLFCFSFWQLFTGICVYWLRADLCVHSELKRNRRKRQLNRARTVSLTKVGASKTNFFCGLNDLSKYTEPHKVFKNRITVTGDGASGNRSSQRLGS